MEFMYLMVILWPNFDARRNLELDLHHFPRALPISKAVDELTTRTERNVRDNV
jgi:hypothetical protein